jgi:hypothetical protein
LPKADSWWLVSTIAVEELEPLRHARARLVIGIAYWRINLDTDKRLAASWQATDVLPSDLGCLGKYIFPTIYV